MCISCNFLKKYFCKFSKIFRRPRGSVPRTPYQADPLKCSPPRTEILAAPLSKFHENYTNSLNDYFLYECFFFGKLKESIKHTLRMRTKNANKVISERLFGRDKCWQSVILHELLGCANEASLRECSHIVHGIQSVSMQMRQHIVSKVPRMSSPVERVEMRICAQSRFEHGPILAVLVPPTWPH